MVIKVLKTAIADADEQEADVEELYVSEARVDGAGRRIGTKQYMEKDRGQSAFHPQRSEPYTCYGSKGIIEERVKIGYIWVKRHHQ